MTTVKISGTIFLVYGCLALLVFVVAFFFTPLYNVPIIWNTRYSSKFSPANFSKISNGMSRTQVVELLGEPLRSDWPTNCWASQLRDERVRLRFAANIPIPIEKMSFSRPRDPGGHQVVCVWIGPDTNVVQCEKWIFD